MTIKKIPTTRTKAPLTGYDSMLSTVTALLESARRASARAVNVVMTATYWEIGRRIVEYEQGGMSKVVYGKQVVDRLAIDLTKRFRRGFGRSNLFQMRAFYLCYPEISQTSSAKSGKAIVQKTSGQLALNVIEEGMTR